MRRHGFTLIELLVVVSIIALLIAILLPSLQKARTAAQAVVCAAHQRQVGVAALSYSIDFVGYVPMATSEARPADWRVMLAPYIDAPTSYDDPADPVEFYNARETAIFDCPLGVHPLTETPPASLDNKLKNRGTFGVILQPPDHNPAAVAVPTFPNAQWTFQDTIAWRITDSGDWERPNQSVYIADAYTTISAGQPVYPSVEAEDLGTNHLWPPHHTRYWSAPVRRFADRHNGTTVLLLDGHVELITTRRLDDMAFGDAENIWDVR